MKPDPRAALAFARIHLGAFAAAFFPGFEFPRHLQLLAQKLEAVERSERSREIYSVPPRHGKSLLASTYFPAWFMGRSPEKSVIFATYSEELAGDFGRRVRNIVADPLYRAIFPAAQLDSDAQSVHRFTMSAGGSYYATGRGGSVTGRGADLLLLDDLIKDADEARSDAVRRSVHDFFRQVAFTRLQPGGAVLLLGTRWHSDDLPGMILREHPAEWEITNLPAIAIEKEPPPLSRKPGDALWPEHFDLERLREYRTVLGGAAFATLYQGNPTSAEGAIFKRQWWQSYDAASPPPFTRTIMSADTAFKATQSADFSAVTIWSEAQSGYFLRHCWKGRVDFPALQRAIELLAHEWRPNYLLVEDAASGQSLIQTLKAETKLPIKAMKVDRDKVTRASAASPLVESGRVFIPASAPWLDSFLDEVSGFPGGAPHDDIVDTVSMALNYFRDSSGGPSRVWTDTGPDSLVRRAYQWRGAF